MATSLEITTKQMDLLINQYDRVGLKLEDVEASKLNDPAWVSAELDRLIPKRGAPVADAAKFISARRQQQAA